MSNCVVGLCYPQKRAVEKQRDFQRIENQKTIRFWVFLALSLLIFLSGIIYIFETNKLAAMGNERRKAKERLESLRKENEEMKLKEAQLRSIYELEKARKNLSLQKPEKVEFLEVESRFAKVDN